MVYDLGSVDGVGLRSVSFVGSVDLLDFRSRQKGPRNGRQDSLSDLSLPDGDVFLWTLSVFSTDVGVYASIATFLCS